SHRLHPSIRPDILDDLRGLLGPDLALRPRNGRIHLFNRYVAFPISPTNLMTKLPSRAVAGMVWDALMRKARTTATTASFESVLLQGLGPTLCRAFYFPFARKLWGLEPGQIDSLQAHRRVSANTAGKLVRKVLRTTFRRGEPGRSYYYPQQGFGQIS